MGWWDDGIMGWWDDGMMGWWDDGMMGWWDVVWGVKLRKNCEVYVLCGRYLPDPYPIYSPNNHRWKRHAARWPHSQMVLSGHRRPDITLKREQNGSRNQEPQQKKLAQIDIFVPIKQNSFAKDTSCHQTCCRIGSSKYDLCEIHDGRFQLGSPWLFEFILNSSVASWNPKANHL